MRARSLACLFSQTIRSQQHNRIQPWAAVTRMCARRHRYVRMRYKCPHTQRHATKYTLTFKVRSVLVKTVRCVRRTHTHAHTIHMSHVAYIFPLAWRTPQFHKLHIHVHIGISLTLLRAIHTLHNDANMQGWHVRTENT